MTVRSRRDSDEAAGGTTWQRGPAARPGHLHRSLATAARPLRGLRGLGPIQSPLVAGRAGLLNDGPPGRRRLFGRLAAMFFAGAGVVGLVTLPLPAPGSDVAAMAAVYAMALALGIAIWFAPWGRWPRRASLAIVLPAFTLIAVGNAFGGRTCTPTAFSLWSLSCGSAWPIRRARRPL